MIWGAHQCLHTAGAVIQAVHSSMVVRTHVSDLAAHILQEQTDNRWVACTQAVVQTAAEIATENRNVCMFAMFAMNMQRPHHAAPHLADTAIVTADLKAKSAFRSVMVQILRGST